MAIESEYFGHPGEARLERQHTQPQIVIHRRGAPLRKSSHTIDQLALDQYTVDRPGAGFQKMCQNIFVIHSGGHIRLRTLRCCPHVLPTAIRQVGARPS